MQYTLTNTSNYVITAKGKVMAKIRDTITLTEDQIDSDILSLETKGLVTITPPYVDPAKVVYPNTNSNGNATSLESREGIQIEVPRAPIVTEQVADFLIDNTHRNKTVPVNAATAVNATIQPDSDLDIPIDSEVTLFRKGAGAVAFVAGAGVTILNPTLALTAKAQYSQITAKKVAADTWVVSGDLG